MPDVFISYTRGDKTRVKLLAEALEAEGFSVWWDAAIRPGKTWHDTISKELAETPAVVVCWSKASVKSDWVLAEATQAYNKHKLAPALIQRCEPPIPYNMVQSADLSHWKGQGDDPEWTSLLLEVRRLVEKSKGKIYGAVPPPGDAHGAELARTQQPSPQQPPPQPAPQPAMQQPLRPPPPPEPEPEPQTVWEEAHYEPAVTRGRMGPRLLRLAGGAVVVTALISGGLWAGPHVIKLAEGMSIPWQTAEPPKLADYGLSEPVILAKMGPPAEAKPPELLALNDAVKFARFKDLPVETPPEAKPPEAKPPETKPPEPKPDPKPPTPEVTPTLEPTRTVAEPPPARTDPALDALDRCLSQLLKLCGKVDASYAADFTVDGKISASERRLLSTPLFPDTGKASTQNLGVCRATVAAGGGRTAARACAAMAPKDPPKPVTSVDKTLVLRPSALDAPIATTPKTDPQPIR